MKKQISIVIASLLIVLFAASVVNAQIIASEVEVRGTISQLQGTNGTNFSVNKWDALNFAGFWYDIDDNMQTESLEIVKFKDNRTIDEGDLEYKTTRTAKKYSVFSNKDINVENSLDSNLSEDSTGGYYAIVGWMAEKYIAVNGKNNKLAKLVYSSSDAHTLKIGEAWDLGEGYSLTAQSIDAKTAPRQAWLSLAKNGVKLEDIVINQGNAHTYSTSLAGEDNVPVFVTYADSIFSGASSDMIQLKYTWVMSDNVTEIKVGDEFGILEVDTVEPLILRNSALLTLTAASTIDISGNMKFVVADSGDDDVRFYPKIDYKLESTTVTVTPTITATDSVTPTITQTTPSQSTSSGITPIKAEEKEADKELASGETKPTEANKHLPGFEAVIATSGLFVVGYIVTRKKR